MNPQLLPAQLRDDVPAWTQTVVAFLAEKERRSGSRRTVEGYARMLWPFLARIGSPDRVTPAHVLAWAHGIGASGREPSSATVGARIACLSSYFRFLIRMNIATSPKSAGSTTPRSPRSSGSTPPTDRGPTNSPSPGSPAPEMMLGGSSRRPGTWRPGRRRWPVSTPKSGSPGSQWRGGG